MYRTFFRCAFHAVLEERFCLSHFLPSVFDTFSHLQVQAEAQHRQGEEGGATPYIFQRFRNAFGRSKQIGQSDACKRHE